MGFKLTVGSCAGDFTHLNIQIYKRNEDLGGWAWAKFEVAAIRSICSQKHQFRRKVQSLNVSERASVLFCGIGW